MNLRRVLILAGIVLALIVALGVFLRSCNPPESNIGGNIQDSLTHYKNKYGEEAAKRTALVGSVTELKKMNAGKDSLLKVIQGRVSNLTMAITAYEIAASSEHTTPTTISFHKDTVAGDSIIEIAGREPCDTVYPVYSSSYTDKWENYTIEAGKDSVRLKHTAFLYPIVEHRYKGRGIFHPPEIELHISDQNPNTKILDAQTFVISQKKQYKGIWLSVGVLGGILITQQLLH